jgi:hypothetical protein
MDWQEYHFKMEICGVSIDAALALPLNGTRRWEIMLVPGSYFNDVDGNYAQKHGNPFEARPNTYRDLARQLAERGRVAPRYALGLGDYG